MYILEECIAGVKYIYLKNHWIEILTQIKKTFFTCFLYLISSVRCSKDHILVKCTFTIVFVTVNCLNPIK